MNSLIVLCSVAVLLCVAIFSLPYPGRVVGRLAGPLLLVGVVGFGACCMFLPQFEENFRCWLDILAQTTGRTEPGTGWQLRLTLFLWLCGCALIRYFRAEIEGQKGHLLALARSFDVEYMAESDQQRAAEAAHAIIQRRLQREFRSDAGGIAERNGEDGQRHTE